MNKLLENRISWISTENKKYLSLDFSFLDDYDVFPLILFCKKVFADIEENDVKLLVNYKGTDFGHSTFSTIISFILENQHKIARIAAYGLREEIRNFYLPGAHKSGLKASITLSKEEALDFLLFN